MLHHLLLFLEEKMMDPVMKYWQFFRATEFTTLRGAGLLDFRVLGPAILTRLEILFLIKKSE